MSDWMNERNCAGLRKGRKVMNDWRFKVGDRVSVLDDAPTALAGNTGIVVERTNDGPFDYRVQIGGDDGGRYWFRSGELSLYVMARESTAPNADRIVCLEALEDDLRGRVLELEGTVAHQYHRIVSLEQELTSVANSQSEVNRQVIECLRWLQRNVV